MTAGRRENAVADVDSYEETYRSWSGAGPEVELSLVVPAFNEAGRLDSGVSRLRRSIAEGAVEPETT